MSDAWYTAELHSRDPNAMPFLFEDSVALYPLDLLSRTRLQTFTSFFSFSLLFHRVSFSLFGISVDVQRRTVADPAPDPEASASLDAVKAANKMQEFLLKTVKDDLQLSNADSISVP